MERVTKKLKKTWGRSGFFPVENSIQCTVSLGKVLRVSGGNQGRKKLWKPRKAKRKMVLRDDVGLKEACNLALCTLVARFSYRVSGDLDLLT